MVFLRFKNDTNSLLLQCPKYLTKVINASRRWTPTLEMNTKTKTTKGSRTTGQTDIIYCHSGDLTPWPAAACAARNYGPREWSPKSDADDRTEWHISSTGPHWGPSDPSVGISQIIFGAGVQLTLTVGRQCAYMWNIWLFGIVKNYLESSRTRKTKTE